MSERLYRWRCIEDRDKALAVLATALEVSDKYLLGISTTNIPFIDVDRKDELCTKLLDEFIEWVKRLLKCDVAVLETDKGYHVVPMTVLVNESELYEEVGARIGEIYGKVLDIVTKYVTYDYIRAVGLEPRDVVRDTEAWRKVLSKVPRKMYPTLLGLVSKLEDYYVQREIIRVKMREGHLYIGGKPTFEEFYRTIKRIAEVRDPRFPWTLFADACIDKAHVECSIKYHRTTLRISAKAGKDYDIKLLYVT